MPAKITISGLKGITLFLALLALRSLSAQNRLAVGYGEGLPGLSPTAVAVTASHDTPIHGFSLAVSYPRTALRLVDISPRGTATASVGVDFFAQDLDDKAGTGVVGAIFAFKEPYQPAELPATAPGDRPQLLAWLVFTVVPGAPAGEYPISLSDGVGNPPVSNRFTYRGTTVRPELIDGAFVIYSENVLTVDSKFAVPGFRLPPLYAYARHPKPLQGFQVAISFDPRALALEEATFIGTDMLNLLGGTNKIEFSQIKWQAADISVSPSQSRTTAGIIFDYLAPFDERQVLPAITSTPGQSIMRYSFQPKDGADQYGESLSLALSDSSNPDAVNNVFISNSASYVPRKIDGRIYFSTGFLIGKVIDYQTGNPISGASATASPGEYAASTRSDGTFTIGGTDGVPPGAYSVSIQKNGYYPARVLGSVAGKGSTTDLGAAALFQVPPSQGGFQRGRLNGDSAMDISDGIVLLSYLFQGSGSLSCLEAADSNDDGTLDLSDAISIFGYLFTSGNPLPAPFFSCGPDPTPDSLGCQSFPGC